MSVSPICQWASNVTKRRTLHLHWQLARDVSPESMGTMITPHVAHPPPSAQRDFAGNRCRSSRIFFTMFIQERFSTYI